MNKNTMGIMIGIITITIVFSLELIISTPVLDTSSWPEDFNDVGTPPPFFLAEAIGLISVCICTVFLMYAVMISNKEETFDPPV
jgi:hypothetical protein